jgi:hypothetical protein
LTDTDHLQEARFRVDKVETAEAQLALGQIVSTPQLHSDLAALAQAASRHLRIFADEQVMA